MGSEANGGNHYVASLFCRTTCKTGIGDIRILTGDRGNRFGDAVISSVIDAAWRRMPNVSVRKLMEEG